MIKVFSLMCLLISTTLSQTREPRSIRECSPSDKRESVGWWLRLPLPEKAIVKKGSDVDYQSYSIGFGDKKNRVWLWGGYGPTWSSGEVPNSLIESSKSYTETKWAFADARLGGGVDVKGQLKNGNYWRFFGTVGQTAVYEDVSKQAADYFDSIIDNICYRKPSWAK